MARVWVLDTETKGTGANMVPLERVLKDRSEAVPGFSFRKRAPTPPSPAAQPEPHRFRVIDVMTRAVLANGVDARGAVEALEQVDRIVDVNVYVWEPRARRWRMLTFAETRALWGHRAASAR